MKKFSGILLVLLAIGLQAFGTHILGGELTYKYLGNNGPTNRPFRYLIHFVGYVDRVGTPGQLSNWGCGNLSQDPFMAIYSVDFDGSTVRIPRIPGTAEPTTPQQNTFQRRLALNWRLPSHGDQVQGPCSINPYYGGIRPLVIPVPVACVVPGLTELNIAITDTIFEVQLPFSAGGYKVAYQNCCRTQNTTNLNIQGGNNDPGNTWVATIPSPIFVNSSPQFIGDAVPFFCKGDTAVISNNAFDPDGDRLIYSFATPYSGNGGDPESTFTEPENSPYAAGFSQNQPFGAAGYAYINPSTGLTKYFCDVNGNYAVAVDIQEYRTLSNGTEILLSTTRREFLVVVKECADNPPPTPGLSVSGQGQTFIRTEGDSVVFDLKSFDLDTTTIFGESELLDPATNPGSLASLPAVTGPGGDSVRTKFRWKINCGITGGIVRNYSVVVKYADRGCPPVTLTQVYTIIVNPFKAPTILGRDSICSNVASLPLSVTAGSGRQWKMLGGSIIGSSTNNNVNVTFPGDTARVRLVVTSGLGCKDSTSKKLYKSQLVPILATSPSRFVCQDSTIKLSATGGYNTVSWTPANLLSSATSRNPVATLSDTTRFIVSSSGPAGCLARDTVDVTWIPKVANAGPDSILCSKSQRIIGAVQNSGYRIYSYKWTPALGLGSDTSFQTKATLTNSGTSNQIFTFVQKATHRASNCASTDTIRLSVKPLPVVNAGPDTATICSGAKTVLGTPESVSATYRWFPETGLLNPNRDTTTVSLNPDSVQPQFVRYRLTKTEVLVSPLAGEPACVNSDSIMLKINPLPFFSLAAKDSICSGFSTNIGTTNQPGFSYLWSPGRGLNSISSPTTAISLVNLTQNPGDTIYKLLVTNNNTNCAREKEINIRVNPLPLTNAGKDTTFCSGDTVRIGEVRQDGFSYSWAPVAGLSTDTSANPLITLINPVVGGPPLLIKYKLTKTNKRTGCQNFDSLNLKVKALPTIDAGPDKTICSGLKTVIGTPESVGALYQWSPNNGILNPLRDTSTVSVNPDSVNPQFYTYRLRKTEGIVLPGEPACSNTDSVVLRVNPLPFFELAAKDSICSGFRTNIGTNNQPGFNYAWSPVNGLSRTDSSRTTVQLVNPGQIPGDTLYSLLVTNATTNCQRAKQINIRVNPLPVVNAGLDTDFCSGDSVLIGESAANGFSYVWAPQNGLNSGTSSSTKLSLINPNVGGSNTTFRYRLTKTNNQTTCKNADSLVLTVKPLPIANAAASDTVVVCSQSTLQIGEAGLQNHQYSWLPDTALTNPGISNPVIQINNPTQTARLIKYRLNVINTVSTCKNRDSVTVRVNPLPIVPLAYSDTSVCSRDTIFIGGSSTAGYTYSWSPKVQLGDSTVALTRFTAVNNTDAPVVYPFNLLVNINATNCKNNKTVNVRVNPLPDANAGPDKEVCSKDSVQIGLPPVAGRKYSWSPVTGLSNPDIANPKLSLVNNGTQNVTAVYTLRVTDTQSPTQCDSSDQVTVTVKPLPNAVAFNQDTARICATIGLGLGVSAEAGLTYSWSPSTNLSEGNVSNPVFTSNVATGSATLPYVVTVTNTSTTCLKKDTVQILVNSLPVVNVGSLDSLCSGDTVQIGPGSGQVPLQYAWTPTTGFVGNNPISQTLTLTNPGSTVVVSPYKLILTNSQTGCRDSATLNVRVNPLPPANAGLDKTICSGQSVAVGAPTQLGFQYSWFRPDASSMNVFISDPTFSMIPTLVTKKDTFIVLMTNATTQCRKRDTAVVTTNPIPVAMTFANYSGTVCPFTPNVNYSVTNTIAGNTYAWVVSGGTQASGGNTNAITVNWGGPNPNAKIVVTPTNGFGCVGKKDSIQLVLNQNLNPVKPIGDSVICSFLRKNKSYFTVPTPGSNYTWRLVNATVDSTISANGATVVDWNIEQGIAKIWIQQQSSTVDPNTNTPVQCYGQSDTLFVEINRSPDSTRSITGPVSVCGKPGGNTTPYQLNGFSGSTYNWLISPSANIVSGQGKDSLFIGWEATGNYQITAVETTNKGCEGIVESKLVEVNPLPSPRLLDLSNLTICPNDLQKGYFAASAPGFANSSFLWTVTGGRPSTPINQTFLGVNWQAEGPYGLKLTETTTKGCVKDTLIPLVADASALVLQNVSLLELDDNQVKLDFAMSSQATNPGGITILRKELNAPVSSWQAIQTNINKNITSYIDQPGNTNGTAYQYKVTGTNVCARAIESDVHNTILLKVNALQAADSSKLDWNAYIGWPGNVKSYTVLRKVDNEASLTEYSTGLPPSVNPRIGFENAGDGFKQCYRIQAFQNDGQNEAFSNTVCVTFNNPLVFYNLFTPNGDNQNDAWEIKNLELYPENELIIFDRWGKKVLDRKNYSNSNLWTGDNFLEGVYFYKFTIPSRSLEYQGWVKLQR